MQAVTFLHTGTYRQPMTQCMTIDIEKNPDGTPRKCDCGSIYTENSHYEEGTASLVHFGLAICWNHVQ